MAKIKNPDAGKLSARINLALPAKLAEDLKTLAFLDGTSVNDYTRRIIAAYVHACEDELEQYRSLKEQIRNEKLEKGSFTVDKELNVGYIKLDFDSPADDNRTPDKETAN